MVIINLWTVNNELESLFRGFTDKISTFRTISLTDNWGIA